MITRSWLSVDTYVGVKGEAVLLLNDPESKWRIDPVMVGVGEQGAG